MHQKNKNTNLNTEAALSKVQFICSRQEKCCYDIRKKLANWNLLPQEQDDIIQSLLDDKFIDEERYALFYVKDKFRFNKWGRIKITYHLKQKQISESIIHSALEQIDDHEYRENLTELLRHKLANIREQDPYQLKAKLFRFAQSRGFESHLALQLIEKLQNNLK